MPEFLLAYGDWLARSTDNDARACVPGPARRKRAGAGEMKRQQGPTVEKESALRFMRVGIAPAVRDAAHRAEPTCTATLPAILSLRPRS